MNRYREKCSLGRCRLNFPTIFSTILQGKHCFCMPERLESR
jgi:hypothetical protein